ncbi:hypothetical protein [Yoonia sp.]|uniref:hypothetical protein n=1 Tax=Yoonia sp. TaxID=2212373 RepID=UPI002E05E2F2|nr:hypothetical protein [Yoonia sp.]
MSDPRYNDIACNLRRLADDLDKQARDHRRLADQLDHLVNNPPDPIKAPPHLAALDAAALQLVDLPAAAIRTQAPIVARAAGQQVLPVAIRAQHLRKARKDALRRRQTVTVMSALANGAKLAQAAQKAGISEATARRLRDAWRDA